MLNVEATALLIEPGTLVVREDVCPFLGGGSLPRLMGEDALSKRALVKKKITLFLARLKLDANETETSSSILFFVFIVVTLTREPSRDVPASTLRDTSHRHDL
jgi:hypothetical protein